MPHLRDRELIDQIQGLGYELVRWKTHPIFRHPCGAQMACSGSTSDRRAMKNSLSLARRLIHQHQESKPCLAKTSPTAS